MAKKYKLSLLLIGLCLCFSFGILFSYAKYTKEEKRKNPIVIVGDGLSVNYREGNHLKINSKTETYTFSVTNNLDEPAFYSIYVEKLNPNNTIVSYDLIEKNHSFSTQQNSLTNVKKELATIVEIAPLETHNYEFIIYNENQPSFQMDLKIEALEGKEEYFASTLLKNNPINKNATTKIGEEIATEEEGLIESTDDFGNAFYFRGKQDQNYVSFAGLLWRIVRINGDGSIKIILNDTIEKTENYYNNKEEQTLEQKLNYETSNIHTFLNNWYKENLEKYEKHIAVSKYCIDTSVSQIEGEKTLYLANTRLLVDYNPEFTCLGESFSSKIGLLSADEVVLAGASKNNNNSHFYLYIPNKNTSWWTSTPSFSENGEITYFEVDGEGKIKNESLGSYFRAIRPVINLQKKVTATGQGTNLDPYVIKE